MNLKRNLAIAVAVLILLLIIGGAIFGQRHGRVTYQGKSVEQWFEEAVKLTGASQMQGVK